MEVFCLSFLYKTLSGPQEVLLNNQANTLMMQKEDVLSPALLEKFPWLSLKNYLEGREFLFHSGITFFPCIEDPCIISRFKTTCQKINQFGLSPNHLFIMGHTSACQTNILGYMRVNLVSQLRSWPTNRGTEFQSHRRPESYSLSTQLTSQGCCGENRRRKGYYFCLPP